MDYLGLALRWLHIISAITAAGGTIFVRFVLLPAISQLPDDARKTLHANVRARWSKIVMGAIAVLLVTGLINFFRVREMFIADGEKLPTLYNALFGIKFLLAMVIFFIASALTGRSAAFDKIRANAKLWLSINVTLILIVVALSNVLRSTHQHPEKTAVSPTTTTTPETPAKN
jgi:uncharacterized membrane protein